MIKIRPYQNFDENAILDLDARVLPSEWNPRSLSNWKWKFTDANPSGQAFIWLAELEGKVIAHFAAVPIKLKVFEEVTMGSHTIGALVEAPYQNRGLLKIVADKLWEDLSSGQILLTWGLPNERAHSLHTLFLGYGDLMDLTTWKKKRPLTARRTSTARLAPIQKFDVALDRLWEKASKDYPICVIRDCAYLNWRYLRRPDWTYYPFGCYRDGELKGYAVLKLFKEAALNRGHIVDIFAPVDDEETFVELIEGSCLFFEHNGVDEITTWMGGQKRLEGLLQMEGFLRTDQRRPLVLRLNSGRISREQAFESTNWYFTMGDSTEIY